MSASLNEPRRQHKTGAPKLSNKHPIACIEKRVIDSEAFAKLQASSVVVLLLLARNLDKGRNGHVFLSQQDAERHGIEKKTLYRQFKNLTAAGFIYPTTRGGHGQCAKYALTWISLSNDTKGLHVDSFVPCAYLKYETNLIEWKKRRGKMSSSGGQKASQPLILGDKKPPRTGDKKPHIEFNTNKTKKSTQQAVGGFDLVRLELKESTGGDKACADATHEDCTSSVLDRQAALMAAYKKGLYGLTNPIATA